MTKITARLFCLGLLCLVSACGPQKLKYNEDGVILLPDPEIGELGSEQARIMVGRRYVGPTQIASSGEIATIAQFLEHGKISTYTVDAHTHRNLNQTHNFGFYTYDQGLVRVAIYAYDPGRVRYRYFIGEYQLDPDSGNLTRDARVIRRSTNTQFPVTRKWMIETEPTH